tara:strand:+ start:1776 stop:2114 length:339 start_codon:yes stop_codon:yes gene_type:complete
LSSVFSNSVIFFFVLLSDIRVLLMALAALPIAISSVFSVDSNALRSWLNWLIVFFCFFIACLTEDNCSSVTFLSVDAAVAKVEYVKALAKQKTMQNKLHSLTRVSDKLLIMN